MHCIINHFLMLCKHLDFFKVFSNQFLGKLREEHILLHLFKGAVVSESGVAISEFPELLGVIEPGLKGEGGCFLLVTVLHEGNDSFPDLINLLCELYRWQICDEFLIF